MVRSFPARLPSSLAGDDPALDISQCEVINTSPG
jgi:hypothetical protein